jgi:hypothetical protein
MSCMLVSSQGGRPEIFPLPVDQMHLLQTAGNQAMTAVLGRRLAIPVVQYVGTALRPDGTPFYLTTKAPDPASGLAGVWRGAFFAPFGVGDIVGTVSGDTSAAPIIALTVNAQLAIGGVERVSAEWVIDGTQATPPNIAALIRTVTIMNSGPHDPDDIRRCIALHAPQRVFGEPKAIVAMQCGVAAAALLEAIC